MSKPNKHLTPTALRAWLVTKDPEATYDFESPSYCLIAQFLKETVVAPGTFSCVYVSLDNYQIGGDTFELPEWANEVSQGDYRVYVDDTGVAEGCTFGRALEILNAMTFDDTAFEQANQAVAAQLS